MFTGIVRARGRIERMQARGGDMRLSVTATGLPWQEYQAGESIAVNGVCLTAVAFSEAGFDTDVSRETLAVTALGGLKVGSAVNLEPALSLGERLGGHLVSGHVDCVGSVRSRENDARSVRLQIELPPEYRRYVAKKGSVCVDGVSLTINAVADNLFAVNIIPHTAEVTIIGEYAAGRKVNIEVDLLARYLERLLTAGDAGGIAMEFLREHGYG
ncbi:MAG: riboflavin synthase [Gammaproteobacteria bacterium]|nr:MAG: riboflavin synthase [Gammaproteobacteria bacterium]